MATIEYNEYFLNMVFHNTVSIREIRHMTEYYLYCTTAEGEDLRIERKYITKITLK